MPNIQIIAVSGVESRQAKSGKTYKQVVVDFTQDGTAGKRTVNQYSDAYKVLVNAKQNELYDVTETKNGEYTNWDKAFKTGVATVEQAKAATVAVSKRDDFEARRQVYIVRQSSLANAIAYIDSTTRTDCDVEEVISVAKEFEAYVFGEADSVEEVVDVE